MTDPKSEIVGLAERVEAATGADRETRELLLAAFEQIYPKDFGRGCDRYGRFLALLDARAYLDAAVSLVPEGYRLQLSEWDDEKHLRARGPWQAILSEVGSRNQGFDPAFKTRCEHAATPALAFCAAALRARATLKEHE